MSRFVFYNKLIKSQQVQRRGKATCHLNAGDRWQFLWMFTMLSPSCEYFPTPGALSLSCRLHQPVGPDVIVLMACLTLEPHRRKAQNLCWLPLVAQEAALDPLVFPGPQRVLLEWPQYPSGSPFLAKVYPECPFLPGGSPPFCFGLFWSLWGLPLVFLLRWLLLPLQLFWFLLTLPSCARSLLWPHTIFRFCLDHLASHFCACSLP